MNYYRYRNNSELIESFSEKITTYLRDTLTKKEEVWIVVCGGSTPRNLFINLSTRNLDWNRVNIMLTDERLVSKDSEESNERMVRDSLIQNNAYNAKFYSLNTCCKSMNNKNSLDLSFLEKILNIDLLILGMGIDGHTASFFPQDPNLYKLIDINNKELFSYVDLADLSTQRITLTYRLLSKSKKTCLYITGKEKKQTFETAQILNDANLMPISVFMQNPIDVYWCP